MAVKVYCEIVDDEKGFMWRIVAEVNDQKAIGEWCGRYESFATLNAFTGPGGQSETWIAGSAYWGDKASTLGGFPEFTPLCLSRPHYSSTDYKEIPREPNPCE